MFVRVHTYAVEQRRTFAVSGTARVIQRWRRVVQTPKHKYPAVTAPASTWGNTLTAWAAKFSLAPHKQTMVPCYAGCDMKYLIMCVQQITKASSEWAPRNDT